MLTIIHNDVIIKLVNEIHTMKGGVNMVTQPVTDVGRLKEAISNSGMSIVAISNKMGITREGFYKKMNGETEFKASEIISLSRILRLPKLDRDKIFLPNQVN